MDKIKSLWEEQRALFLVIAVLLIVVLVFLIINPAWVLYLVVAGIVLVVLWLSFDTLIKSRKRKRQENLDERIAAKEGIEDRKREWLSWSQELRKHGIDRHELPFYLLVGEPQSGKSILLQNSGLNFPLGQNKLSGPGGTRGCDWWFTEEAVVLDLAGRLFTHEGGKSDATEWEAFLGLLAAYRPLSPANGILLVIPCDSLLQDSAEVTKSKAKRIQESLTTLVNKLEAQLPIYVVLTKADKVFGFAESVHRLDAERRRQMFGWSRSSDDFEKPFSLPEFREAFERIRTRAHLMRAGAMSSAQVPDALPEIDRLFAFPEELGTLAKPLESYMECIFSESALVERLFFRGLYLTSGLQQGAPIAQACAALLGSNSEADTRNLEGLFTKQRSYFIHDFVQRRVFGERGLVRPTSSRVYRSRKMAFLGYGTAAAITVLGSIWFGYSTMSSGSPTAFEDYSIALGTTKSYLEVPSQERDLKRLLTTLGAVQGAINSDLPSVDSAFSNNASDFENLHGDLCRSDLARLVRQAAEKTLAKETHQSPADCTLIELEELTLQLDFLLGTMPVDGGDKPVGGFSLADENHRSLLEEILALDDELAGFLKQRTNRDGQVVGESVFATALAIHLEEGGGFAASQWEPSSGVLTKAAEGLAGLYDAFLTDDGFAAGQLPPPLETYSLERVAAAHRLRATLITSAAVLSGKNSPPCQEILSSKRKLDGAISGLGEFVKDYKTVVVNQFWDEYSQMNLRFNRVMGAASVDPPTAWTGFASFAEGLFEPSTAGKALFTWNRLADGRASSGAFPLKPRALSRLAGRLRGQLGGDPLTLLSGGSGKPATAKAVLGDLSAASEDKVYGLIGLEASAMAKVLTDCENAIFEVGSPVQPVALLMTAARIWQEEADPSSLRSRSLAGQLALLQPAYVEFYAKEKYGYEALANTLALNDAGSAKLRKFNLHIPAAEHLFGMYLMLSQMDAEVSGFKPWLAALNEHIQPLLKDAQQGAAEAAPEQFIEGNDARYVAALAMAWSVGNDFKSQASDLLANYLELKRAGLMFEWDGMEGFNQVMDSLLDYLEVENALTQAGYFGADRERQRVDWFTGRVDPYLVERLDLFDDEVRLYWREAAEIKEDELGAAARTVLVRLGSAFEGSMRPRSQGAPDYGALNSRLTEISALLGEEGKAIETYLPATGQSFAALNSLDYGSALAKAKAALASDEVSTLTAFATSLRGPRARDVTDEQLARGLEDLIYTLGTVRSDVAGDVGMLFLEGTLLEFHRVLHSRLAALYGVAFKEKVLGAYRDTLDSELFRVNGEASLSSVQTSDIQELLRAAVKLRKRFRCEKPSDSWPASDVKLRLRPFPEGGPNQQWDDFLYSLALMFGDQLEGDLEAYEFKFKLAPDSGKNFWSNRGKLDNGKNLAYWWPMGKQESVEVASDAQFPQITWRFGSRSRLYMAWNKSTKPPEDSAGLSLSLKGTFAPLALAWHHGALEQGDSGRYLLSIALDSALVGGQAIPLKMSVPQGFPDLPQTSMPAR